MAGPPRRNEDRFYRYPKNRIVAVQARQVATAVHDAGGRYVLFFGAWTVSQLPG